MSRADELDAMVAEELERLRSTPWDELCRLRRVLCMKCAWLSPREEARNRAVGKLLEGRGPPAQPKGA